MDDYRTFPCPKCREIIDTTMPSCKFCGVPIDHASAAEAATLQEQVQQACGQASSARITAMVMPVFFLLSFAAEIFSFVPLIGFIDGGRGEWSGCHLGDELADPPPWQDADVAAGLLAVASVDEPGFAVGLPGDLPPIVDAAEEVAGDGAA